MVSALLGEMRFLVLGEGFGTRSDGFLGGHREGSGGWGERCVFTCETVARGFVEVELVDSVGVGGYTGADLIGFFVPLLLIVELFEGTVEGLECVR